MTITLEAPAVSLQVPVDLPAVRQQRLEEEALQAGIVAYRNQAAKLANKELEDITDYGISLLSASIEPMEKAICSFMADAYTKAGPKAAAFKYLELIEPDVAALITAQVIIEAITVQRAYQGMGYEVGKRFEDEVRFRGFEKENKRLFNGVMRNLEKHPMGYQMKVRRSMLVHTANKFKIMFTKWSIKDKVLLGTTLIDLFVNSTGLVSVSLKPGKRGVGLVYVLTPTPALLDRIRQYKDCHETLHPKYLPMICPPQPWTTPTSGGYFSERLKVKLVKSRTRGYQQELANTDMPAVYDAVNRLQATPWKINAAMHTVVQELWEAGLEVKGFPSRHDQMLPVKPQNYESDREARTTWKKMAGDVFRGNLRSGSKRIQTAKILFLAEKFSTEESIWFPVQLDFRGRMYPMPQHLNPQGCDLAKSLLTFADGKPLGYEGTKWLAVHLANTFGFDKCSLAERQQWALDNSDRIERTANDPLEDRWWMEADKPFQFLAAAIEWLGYLHDGGPDYVCHLPIMVDGSCNGLQHFSAMLRDEVCGAKVNLIAAEKPSDIYETVADQVRIKVDADAKAGNEFANQWFFYGINRKLCKRPVMVLPYGGTREAVRKYVLEYVQERAENRDPHPFGDQLIKATNYLSTVIWDTMKEVVKGPRIVMDWLQQSARTVSKTGLAINWHTPSGFLVQQAYLDTKTRRVMTKIGGKVTRLKMREETDRLDPRKQAQAIAPNFVHSLDAAALALTIVQAAGRGIDSFCAVHDSYGTLAADMPVLLDTLRECFVQMYETHDVLSEFARESGEALDKAELPPIPSRGTLDIRGVLASDFFFA